MGDFDIETRNNVVDTIYATFGPNLVAKVFTGSKPGSTALADSGTPLGTINLPGDWMAPVSGGSAGLTTTYPFTVLANGTAGYVRLYSEGGTCRFQENIGSGGWTVTPGLLAEGQAAELGVMTVTTV